MGESGNISKYFVISLPGSKDEARKSVICFDINFCSKFKYAVILSARASKF